MNKFHLEEVMELPNKIFKKVLLPQYSPLARVTK